MKLSKMMMAFAVAVAALMPAAPAQASVNVCYKAYERGNGWEQYYTCNGNGYYAGTVGQARPIEAALIDLNGLGNYCTRAHLRDVGWEDWQCVLDSEYVMIGNPGETMEAIEILVEAPYTVCGRAHVTEIGWQGSRCGHTITIGTTGQALWMEAFELWD